MIRDMKVSRIYETELFKMLASGMKDREAFDIVAVLMICEEHGMGMSTVFTDAERFAREHNNG